MGLECLYIKDAMGFDAGFIERAARKRNIPFRHIDREKGIYTLRRGKTEFLFQDSLSPFASAPAVALTDDKYRCSKFLRAHGCVVAPAALYSSASAARTFLKRHAAVVVKPTDGRLGQGVVVDIRTYSELQSAVKYASKYSRSLMIEKMVAGRDFRILIIDYRCVAVLERVPAHVIGDGVSSIDDLARRRERSLKKTDPQLHIPVDAETTRVLAKQGFKLSQIPPAQTKVFIRYTANRHTGGVTIDRTTELPEQFKAIAVRAARLTNLPVVGVDMIIPEIQKTTYSITELNAEPYLAFHAMPEIGEPVRTDELFLDFFEKRARALS